MFLQLIKPDQHKLSSDPCVKVQTDWTSLHGSTDQLFTVTSSHLHLCSRAASQLISHLRLVTTRVWRWRTPSCVLWPPVSCQHQRGVISYSWCYSCLFVESQLSDRRLGFKDVFQTLCQTADDTSLTDIFMFSRLELTRRLQTLINMSSSCPLQVAAVRCARLLDIR